MRCLWFFVLVERPRGAALTRRGHGLLRCPICRLDLAAAASALACRNGHSFDLAREGYVNLLRTRRRLPSAGGDNSEQVHHREAFLQRGHFDAVAAKIATRVTRPARRRCGFRHRLSPWPACRDARCAGGGLGLDIAGEAARRAPRRWPQHAFAVADLWREWPVKDAAADLLISILAPKNFAETVRVLAPRGWLAIVYPGPNHLIELVRSFDLMRQHAGKDRRSADDRTPHTAHGPQSRRHSRGAADGTERAAHQTVDA